MTDNVESDVKPVKPEKTNKQHIFILVHGSLLALAQYIQVNLIITLSLGSMKTDRVISEPCYNEVIYNRHIAK